MTRSHLEELTNGSHQRREVNLGGGWGSIMGLDYGRQTGGVDHTTWQARSTKRERKKLNSKASESK
jgi:hypothetical protein